MRILFLSRVMPVHGSGGMQQHAENVIKYLKKKADITVVTTTLPEGPAEIKKDDIRTIYLRNTKPGKYYGGWWKQSGRIMKELLKQESFDVILSESVSAYSFFKYKLNIKYNIPAFSFCHGVFPKEINTTMRKRLNVKLPLSILYKIWNYIFIDRNFYPQLTGIIAASREIQEYFSSKYPDKKADLVYNGIDTELFVPQRKNKDLLARYNIKGSDIVLLSVGRLEKEKGVDDLLDAFSSLFKKHANLKLIWAGEGKYYQEVKNKLDRKHIKFKEKIIFTGVLEQKELSDLYGLADIFVFPSLCDEGLPLVVLEAVASGIPVVGSAGRGINEVIEEGKEGLLYPRGDVKSLENKIEQLINSPQLLQDMKVQARKKAVSKFSIHEMGSKIENILNEEAKL